MATQGFFGEGGGVLIVKASPMITKNVITHNTGCGGGAGILLSTGAPVIKGNTISQNSQTVGCSGGDGGALTIHGGKGALILNNTIIDNPGGGIVLNSTGSLLVENNVITGNSGSAVHLSMIPSPSLFRILSTRTNRAFTYRPPTAQRVQ
jgi:parallel beta-helix repeat protein